MIKQYMGGYKPSTTSRWYLRKILMGMPKAEDEQWTCTELKRRML